MKILEGWQESAYKVGIANVFFIVLLFLAPSDKAVFLVSTLHLLSLLWITNSVLETFVSVYWPWFVFEFGRDFSLTLVPLEHIRSAAYQSPVVSSVLFSPFNVLVFLMLFVVLGKAMFGSRELKCVTSGWFALAVLYLGVRLISAVATPHSMLFSLAVVMRQDIAPIVWLVCVLWLGKPAQLRFWKTILATFSALFTLEASLAALQMLRGGFLGLHAERAWYIASFGQGSDEQAGLLRVAGFWAHPNALADWIMQEALVIVLLGRLLYAKISEKMQFLSIAAMMMGISLLSLTRTVLLSLVAVPFLYWPQFVKVTEELWEYFWSKPKQTKLMGMVVVLVAIGVVILRVKDRILLSFFAFSEYGGITTRLQQYTEALDLIAIRPLFGHGVGMYQAALYHWFPEGSVLYFPEKVHNAFLLIAAESGLVSVALAICLVLSIMRMGFKYLDKRLVFIWFLYNTLYLVLQPVSHSVLAMGNIMILALAEYEKNKT